MDISDFVKKAKEYNVLGIKISKDNELAAEWYSEPECRRNIYSATKSFTSCAVGFAVQEGLIDLNEKLTEAFSGDLPECIDENLKEATVRDLLTMCLGQEKGSLMGAYPPTLEPIALFFRWATRESSTRRRFSSQGSSHIRSQAAAAPFSTCAVRARLLVKAPQRRFPSAVWIPSVSVAISTMRSTPQHCLVYVTASARVMRPSASVLFTSIYRPDMEPL